MSSSHASRAWGSVLVISSATALVAFGADLGCAGETTQDAAPIDASTVAIDAGGDTGASPSDAAADTATIKDAETDVATVDASDAGAADAADADGPHVVAYDAVRDYSHTANPNGPWSYGYTPAFEGDGGSSDGGSLKVFSTNAVLSAGQPSIWYDPTNVVSGAPCGWRNEGDAGQYGVSPGQVSFHPGAAGEYTIVRWKAPTAGTFNVHVKFFAGDTGDTEGFLVHQGITLIHDAHTDTNPTHDLAVTVAAGDYVDAVVGYNGDFAFDNTPLEFTLDPQ